MTLFNFLTGGILNKVLDTLSLWKNTALVKWQTGVTADTAIITAQISAQVEMQKQAAALVMADKGWWVTAWMKPAAFYVSLAHYAGVVFDSLPWFGHRVGSWGVPVLPGQYASMEETIILVCVGIVGLKGITRIFTSGMK